MPGRRFYDLLSRLCDETITPREEEELRARLVESAEARQAYSDYLDTHLSMVDHALSSRATVSAVGLPRRWESPSGRTPSIGGSTRRWGASAAALAAVLLIGVGLAVLSRGRTEEAGSVAALPAPAAEQHYFLARITDVSDDVQWVNSASDDFLLRLSLGNRIEIASGTVRVDYYTGASLLLHGSSSFVLTGESSGRLHYGTLHGAVSEGDFLLTTPTARVLDLGTEFGVSVDPLAGTDVRVFDGEVEVSAEDGSVGQSPPVRLKRGGAVSVARGGFIESQSGNGLDRLDERALRFPDRRLAHDAEGPLSLVDVLCASDSAAVRLTGVVAPDTGEPDRQPWLRTDGPGYSLSSGYRVAGWHPFVDGVFIPRAEGGLTRIDSSGKLVPMPASTGRTWGPIWSRRKTPSAVPASVGEDYWGTDTLDDVATRFAECEHGMIGIHSNAGVTFDLDAIAEGCGRRPTRFSGAVCNLDNSQKRLPAWAAGKRFSADLRVFVDGELREGVLSFTRKDGELEFATAIGAGDRFLTLVTTDDGERNEQGEATTDYGDAYDHVVLIDPVLSFRP